MKCFLTSFTTSLPHLGTAIKIQRTTGLTPLYITTGLLLGGLCLSPAHGQASFQGLGDLPGGIFESRAKGVSADGLVVVGEGIGVSGSWQAFRWTSGGGMVGLGDLQGSTPSSFVNGVSADGLVVVGSSNSAANDPEIEAFRWTIGGGMVGLGDLPGNVFFSRADGVSANGSVVVGFSIGPMGSEAFLWTNGSGMVGLGDLPGGSFDSHAFAVSDDGSVVVGTSSSASGGEAFRWTSEGGMVGLGDLAGGEFSSKAVAVSTDGKVVVGSSISNSSFYPLVPEAFRWTSESGMVGLGDLPGGIFQSRAADVSADGSVVVGQSSGDFSFEAFIWDTANGMQNLQTVLEDQLGLDLTGWMLGAATGVSADGTIIVGVGLNPDVKFEAFIATIPGPNVCLGDIVGLDGKVNVTDLLSLLAAWGPNPGHAADLNVDGTVNVFDLLAILAAWGACQ